MFVCPVSDMSASSTSVGNVLVGLWLKIMLPCSGHIGGPFTIHCRTGVSADALCSGVEEGQSALLCPAVHLDCADGHSGRCCLDLSPIVKPGDSGRRVAVHSAAEVDSGWGGHCLVD